jgi:rSAM/selenodomain-associated transferase 2
MRLSIVMPVLNEAERLPDTVRGLARLQAQGAEVIVVDGGSEDGTPARASAAGLRVLRGPTGRARQMNAGARAAGGDVLLFLHADTVLPENALAAVVAALDGARRVWGRFDVRIEGRSPLLAIVARLMNWRSRITGIATGDQAIFIARHAFDVVGGFPDQPLMEDIEMSKRLRKLSAPACLKSLASTSGRRWEQHGVWRTIFLMWHLRWAYWRGVPASQLAGVYK